jgi:dihydroorotate dehydrogenase
VYSGLVYEGPSLVGDIVEGLRDRLAGASWEDVIGVNAR